MSTIAMPTAPLYQQGWNPLIHKRRHSHSIWAPRVPLYQAGLGADSAKIIGASAPIAATVTASLLANTAWASAAGPIGAAVGLVVGVIAGLWAAHEARAAGAKSENTFVGSAVVAFDGGIKAIFDAANSNDPAKHIDANSAAGLVQQLYSEFWATCIPQTHGPGRADPSNGGANCGGPTNMAAPCAGMPNGHFCNKSCTVSCCVGCQDIKPTVDQAVALFQSGNGGSVQVCPVAGDKYGLPARAGYTLTYTPPAISSSASGILSALTGGSGGSTLPLIAIAALAFLALK